MEVSRINIPNFRKNHSSIVKNHRKHAKSTSPPAKNKIVVLLKIFHDNQ